MKLRLIVTEDCPRNCAGCCNQDHALSSLPPLHVRNMPEVLEDCEMVMLTGGEPMLRPLTLDRIITEIRHNKPDIPIYVYTAGPTPESFRLSMEKQAAASTYFAVSDKVDGFTYTIHEPEDIAPFASLLRAGVFRPEAQSLRLNVFGTISEEDFPADLRKAHALHDWAIKWNMQWIEDCPLPEGELLMQWQRSI